MSRKIPEFPVRDLSLLSASEAELYGTHSEIRRQAKSNNPSEESMMFSMAAPTFDIGTGASGVKWGQCRPDARRVVLFSSL
jgi:hypothetical protein